MIFRALSKPPFWLIVLAGAMGCLVLVGSLRARRVNFVSRLAAEEALIDPKSPTGYADGKRWLIVPEHNNPTYQWLEETQQMVSRGEWRVRNIDYENAPSGREVHSASLYRWWLWLVAMCHHGISGSPLGFSLERATLFADPALHLLLLIGATLYVARRVSVAAAALLSVGIVATYPLSAAFLPGVANEYALAQALAFWSVLPMIVAVCGGTRIRGTSKNGSIAAVSQSRIQRSFLCAGVVGGLGLWVSVATEVPVLLGIGLGGILAAVIERRNSPAHGNHDSGVTPWRHWALGGAVTCLVCFLIEYFPGHLDVRLQVNHPLYGVAWLGLGELLTRFEAVAGKRKNARRWTSVLAVLLALLALLAVPIAMVLLKTRGFLTEDLLASRLSNESDGVVANSLLSWLGHDGIGSATAAACVPVLLLALPVWLLFRRELSAPTHTAVAWALGPAGVALAFAFVHIRWLNTYDALLLVTLIAAVPSIENELPRGLGQVLRWTVIAVLLFGLFPALLTIGLLKPDRFTRAEVEGLYERAIAHWIADHASSPQPLVLVPPYRTSSFCFYGGLRGLGTPNWENKDGLSITSHIVGASRSDEAQALIEQHGVNYIVVPSWDTDLDEFAKLALQHAEDSFYYRIRHGMVFDWIRPVPYKLPAIAGFEGQTVGIFEIIPETDRATSISRLTEYLVEMNQLDLAASGITALRHYPADLGALVAIVEAEKARGDADAFAKDFKTLLSNLSTGSDRLLPWDRRVSLGVVLAMGGKQDLARRQVERCLKELDPARIRFLTTGSLYRLQVLCKAFGLALPDEASRTLARKLLPEEMRERL